MNDTSKLKRGSLQSKAQKPKTQKPKLKRGNPPSDLEQGIENSRYYLLSRQDADGVWVDELESNATITAELIFFMHMTGRVDAEKQEKLVSYLLGKQREDGSWTLYYGGPCDINSTVECYMALKMAGYSSDHPALVKAREAIFANGGIKATRVFTKIFLAIHRIDFANSRGLNHRVGPQVFDVNSC